MPLQHLTNTADLSRLLDASERESIWVLKHSSECGLSARAFEAFARHSEESAHLHCVVTVQDAPRLSQLVEETLQLRHESPQVLLVQRRAVAWTTSHRGITLAALTGQSGTLLPEPTR